MRGILATRLGQKHFNFSSRERSPKQRRVCFDETQRVGGVNIPNHVPHDVDLHKETINQFCGITPPTRGFVARTLCHTQTFRINRLGPVFLL